MDLLSRRVQRDANPFGGRVRTPAPHLSTNNRIGLSRSPLKHSSGMPWFLVRPNYMISKEARPPSLNSPRRTLRHLGGFYKWKDSPGWP